MPPPEPPATSTSRRSLLLGSAATVAVAACTDPAATPPGEQTRLTRGRTLVLPADDSPKTLRAATRAFFARAATVVVVDDDRTRWPAAARAGADLGAPLLRADEHLAAELDRLGTSQIVSYAARDPGAGGRRVVAGPGSGEPDPALRLASPPRRGGAVVLTSGSDIPDLLAATMAAAGARPLRATGGDPRADAEVIAALREHPDASVVGIGPGFGGAERFAARVHTARTAAQLPGGGILALPANHFVAIYGNPLTASLGLLGEQDARAAVTRVGALVGDYAALLDGPVRPAFELIATVAAGDPGADGSYSTRTDPGVLAAWIDVAEEAGVYCLLDLQPGRSDFLTQAREYAALLRRPGVGLALDPEWRLQPGELPLTRIGHVEAAEVNAVSAWLAQLVRYHNLPPKLLVLHQFQLQMLRDRDQIDTGHDELQLVIHVDGSGSQPLKQSTWNVVRDDLPDGVFLGWKNFVDEDAPMLTPAQTVAQVAPFPSLVTYQ